MLPEGGRRGRSGRTSFCEGGIEVRCEDDGFHGVERLNIFVFTGESFYLKQLIQDSGQGIRRGLRDCCFPPDLVI